MDDAVRTATAARTEETVLLPGRDLRHDRYEIGAKLGEGGMGVVYRAHDTRDGRDVALKLMKSTLTGTSRRRFEREFRTIAALQHPHCIRVFDYGEVGGDPFFTMELFPGRPITSLAGRGLDEVLGPLLRMTLALDYIHHYGIIHRDVKPSNVLVRPAAGPDGTPGHELRLMDFGLAKYYGVKSSLSAEAGFVGTVAYCAPEQINNDELDHRADLYCLGLVSYELLSGRYPFPEARLAGMRPLMRAQLNDKPRPLSEVNPEVPGPIADAVMRYLRKEPRRRPVSASLLRDAIAAHLGIDSETVVFGVTQGAVQPRLSLTGFVCRAREIEALDDVLRRCLRPSDQWPSATEEAALPSLVVISGEPGIGKSSVVQEAERIARGHGCQVYEGRCYDGNLSPFQPFVEIIRQLIAELRLQERREAEAAPDVDLTATHAAGLPVESAARLLALVNDYSSELLRIAPELRKYLAGEAYRQSDPGSDPDYIFRALSSFFVELATLQPACLSFEDLQWADKSSLDLLRHLATALTEARQSASRGPAAAPRLTIIASARTGYPQLEDLMAPLRERHQIMELSLTPLGDGETRELIALRLNCRPEDLSDDLVARVNAQCGGNPFFVSETVREWFEKETITRRDGGWELAVEAADASALPQTVRDAMRLRLQGLPATAQQVVGAAAVIGAVVDIDLLRDVLPDLTETDVLDAIDALLPRRVFRETGNAGRVEFVHDLLRELPYGDLSSARRQSLHRRVGELLERRRTQGQAVSPAILADHFRVAEDRPKALAYALEAAEAASNTYAFKNAIAHLDDALKLLPEDADAATHYRILDKLGIAYSSSGQLDDAIDAYQQALGHAGDRVARATAHSGIGEAYHWKSLVDDALRHFDVALSEVGYPRPPTVPGRLLDMFCTSIYFHVLPSWFRLPDGGPERDRRLEIAFDATYRCGRIHASRNIFEYTYASYKAAAFAKQSRKPEHVAVADSKLAINFSAFSFYAIANFYIRRARKAAALCARKEVQAMMLASVGTARYMSGRLAEAETDLRGTTEMLEKIGDYYGVFAHHFLRHVYGIRGDIPREMTEAETEISLATASGDAESLAWGRYGKANALARAGRVDEARSFADLAVESLAARNSTTTAIAHQILGFVRLQASDYYGARVALERARSSTFRTLYLIEITGPIFPLLVESLLGPRWATTKGGPSRAEARKARREGRFARFVGWRFPNYRSHALRVSGRAAQALGKTKQAARYFEQAIIAAEKLGARYDLARALLDASRVIPDKADAYRQRGQQVLDELGAVVPEAERLPSPEAPLRRTPEAEAKGPSGPGASGQHQ